MNRFHEVVAEFNRATGGAVRLDATVTVSGGGAVNEWDELQEKFDHAIQAALNADLTALESNVEFHLQGRGGRIACVSGWSRDGYFCLSAEQEDLTLHAFTEAVNGEFPDAARIDVRGEDGAWIANGKLEAIWQERHYSKLEKAALIRSALDRIQEEER